MVLFKYKDRNKTQKIARFYEKRAFINKMIRLTVQEII